jgi:FtsZ-interacting cell division protein ZipA
MATSRAKAAVKKYVTPKWISIAIAAICISIVVIMLFGGWSIRETKERIKPLENNQEVFKKQSEAEKKIINQINLKVDSLEKVIEAKNKERAKQIIIIQQKKDDRVKEITKPDFSNDDIRRGFAN